MALFADLSSLLSMTKEKAGKNMEEARNYIFLDLGNIAKCIGLYHPLEVLKMAAWEERRISRSRAKDPEAQLLAHLLPVLLQSVVQSTLFDVRNGISSNRAIKQKDWNRLVSLTEDMVRRILRYIDAYTVFQIKSGKIAENEGESYRSTISAQLFPPSESEDNLQRSMYIWYGSIASDSARCRELFDVEPERLCNELYKVSLQGISGIDKLTDDISVYKAEMMLLMAQKRSEERYSSMSEDELRDMIVHEEGWEGRVSRLAGQRDDFDLFRPEFVADLPAKAYETLSVYPGTLDIMEYLKKGVWPSTVFPFLRFGSMYYSFTAGHILSYGERILAENASLYLTDTEAAYNACSLIFTNTEVPDVYSFDGNKIDIHVISSLEEVNAFMSPEFYASRMRRRIEDMEAKPQLGHRLLFVDPDGFAELRKLGDDIFMISAYNLFRAVRDKESRRNLLHDIFGTLDLGTADEESALFDAADEDFLDFSSEGDDPVDDNVSDEYEYDTLDDDEKARTLEEKEKELEEDPGEFEPVMRADEIRALQDKYELTEDIIEKDQEQEREADEYEKELDDDDYLYDDDLEAASDDSEDEERENEEFYDEAEEIDEYDNQTVEDPDQLSFLDELLSETESEIDAEEEEHLYMKEEAEAAAFADTDSENVAESSIEMASEDDEADDPLRDERITEDEIAFPSVDVSDPLMMVLPDSFEEKEVFHHSCEEQLSSPDYGVDGTENDSGIDASMEVPEPDPDSDQEASGEWCAIREENGIPGTCPEVEDVENEIPEPDVEPIPSVAAVSLSSDSPCSESISGSEMEAEAGIPDSDDEYAADADTDVDAKMHSDQEVTTDTLIDKGIVRKVETDDGQSVFVMSGSTEDVIVKDEEDEEEDEELPVLDGILKDISDRIGSKGPFMRFIAAADGDMLDYLSRIIHASWEKQQADGKDKMFSVFDYSISVILASPNAVRDELRKEALLNNAGAVMYSRHKEEWNALVLVIDDSYELEDAFETVITPSSFSPSNWKICSIIGEQLIQRGK